MSIYVSQMMRYLCDVVQNLPVGTNLAMVHLLWMLVGGQLLFSRGAVIPALAHTGLSRSAVRRAWQALRRGGWHIGELLVNWEAVVMRSGQWQVRYHGGYCAIPADLTGFWRPTLKNCPTEHYDHQAGKALPAIVLGLVGRVGQIAGQRLLLPLGILRADPEHPDEETLMGKLMVKAKMLMQPQDVLVCDGGFGLEQVLKSGVARFILKVAKNFTARRATPPDYCGIGRPAQRGEIVRPLARTFKKRRLPATPPDRSLTWSEEGDLIQADLWDNLVLRSTSAEATRVPTFSVIAIHDPRWSRPLLLAVPTDLATLEASHLRRLYLDRWPVEQLPLAAKQMIGAQRAFVYATESCQRLPELALLAGSILSVVAAMLPAIPTGFWDRRPQPTPGRLRRSLFGLGFPVNFSLPPEIRQKASFTAHLPKGFWGQHRKSQAIITA
jgi:hypothetical protein